MMDLIIVHDDDGAIHASRLVRCKDCKHGEPYATKTGKTLYYCEMLWSQMDPDWFCADGEVKNEEV